MGNINTTFDFDLLPIKPHLLTDEPVKHHPANLFFNLCVTHTSPQAIALVAALRTPMSDSRSALILVVDCAVQLLGWHALGVSELQKYRLGFYADFSVEILAVTASLNVINAELASFSCSITTTETSQQRLIAEASGTLIHRAPDK